MKSFTLAFIAICMIAVLIQSAEANDVRQRGHQSAGVRGMPSRGLQTEGGPPGNPGAPGRGPPGPPPPPGAPGGPHGQGPPMPGKPEKGSGESADASS